MVSKPIGKLLGYKRDRLEVVEYLGLGKYDKHWWKCSCECGGEIKLTSAQVKSGPKSCGCFRVETLLENRADPVKHGLHNHPLYHIWHGIKQRCYNPNSQRYNYYGEKGIKLCDEWQDVTKFYDWSISNGWSQGLSIDRLDSSKDYSPDNCEWVTVPENSRRMNASYVK